jgi:hypothetical protein
MIKIAGCWDIWYSPQDEYLKFWQFMLKGFGVNKFCMTPNSGLGIQLKNDHFHQQQDIFEFDSMQKIVESNSDCIPIVVDEHGQTCLTQFEHPENALYIFGKTGKSYLEELNWEGQSVYIKNFSNERSGFLHPHQAASIVLYDRMFKAWQS